MRPASPFRVRPLPRPHRSHQERRHHRSEHAGTALQLALNAATRRSGLDVMMLVDDTGMLIGSSTTALDLSMVAAVTPIVGRGRAVPKISREGRKREMSVRPLQLQGEMVYVAAVGGNYNGRRRELAGGCAAATRILG